MIYSSAMRMFQQASQKSTWAWYASQELDMVMLIIQICMGSSASCQWEFQDPKMQVPTIYKAFYVRDKFQGIYPQNMACMAVYGTVGTVPPF